MKTRKIIGLAGALLVCGPLLFEGCSRETRPWNFVLITLDTMRADHLGASGQGRAATPHLDALAAGGTLFRNARALTPITLTSHASMFFSERRSRFMVVSLSGHVPELAGLCLTLPFQPVAGIALC